jgi:hypothetical protein
MWFVKASVENQRKRNRGRERGREKKQLLK